MQPSVCLDVLGASIMSRIGSLTTARSFRADQGQADFLPQLKLHVLHFNEASQRNIGQINF